MVRHRSGDWRSNVLRLSSLVWLLALSCLGQNEGIQLARFGKDAKLKLLKDARLTGGVLRLTAAKEFQTGAAWAVQPQAVSGGFESRFRFRLTEPADNEFAGADGFAFVIQTMGTGVIAGTGSAGGFSLGRGGNERRKGIPRSLALFFDTYRNLEEEDVSSNSLGLFTNGDGYYLPRRLALNTKLPVVVADGQEHEVRVVYQKPSFRVYLDGREEPVLETSIDVASVVGGSGLGYVGFTAATGSGFQNHEILSWEFRAGAALVSSSIQFENEECLAERTLCTPPRAKVEAMGPGRWKVVLPAHLEWGASVETKKAVRVVAAGGTVCWSVAGKANHGCNGPEGDASMDRTKTIDPRSAAGSLIQQRSEGRVSFSVNGLQSHFEKNEGYFHFEVEEIP
jgi:hypothetical protein